MRKGSLTIKESKFSWPVRVYYEDTDAAGVVYYANYLKFMERARTEWLRAQGWEQDDLKLTHNIQFVVKKIICDYKKPARFNHELVVGCELKQVRGASLVFNQGIVLKDSSILLCQADVTIACIDAVTFKPTAIPIALSGVTD